MNILEEFKKNWDEQNFKKNIIDGKYQQGHGHTKPVAYLDKCFGIPVTSNYYVTAMRLEKISVQEGIEILQNIESMQVKDEADEFFGCTRWYFEEDKIYDTNGAFFGYMPIIIFLLTTDVEIPKEHLEIIMRIFGRAKKWFVKEIKNPILYYSNKILSDGAAALALGHILKDDQTIKEGIEFFDHWEKYTTSRGWGWGENVSPGYTTVILDALVVADIILKNTDPLLAQRLMGHREKIAINIAFHGDRQMVPAIRSYNFEGNYLRGNAELQFKVGLNKDITYLFGKTSLFNVVATYELYKDINTYDQSKFVTGEVLKESVFDHAFSYTWKGENCRLGTLNQYPVLANCNQMENSGLGWQSMPSAFLVDGKLMGYSRFRIEDSNGLLRTHPAYSHRDAYLNTSLVSEKYSPSFMTNCSQNKNCAIVIRTVEKVFNSVKSIADEWIMHNFDGHLIEIDEWFVLIFEKCSIAIKPLGGVFAISKEKGLVEVIKEDKTLMLRNYFYDGDIQQLYARRLECAWVICALDNIIEEDEIKKKIKDFQIIDNSFEDYEIRRDRYTLIRNIKLLEKDKVLCDITFDILSKQQNFL